MTNNTATQAGPVRHDASAQVEMLEQRGFFSHLFDILAV